MDKRGIVILRSRNPFHTGADQSNDDHVSRALKKDSVASTQIIPKEGLFKEGNGLSKRST